MSSRKSQVDKFNSRYAKDINDINAIKSDSLKQEKEEIKHVEELKKQGNIKEAAMVVSYEGLKAFSKMFTNTISQEVNSSIQAKMTSLEESIDKMLEDKITQVLSGLSEGIEKFNTEVTTVETSKVIDFPIALTFTEEPEEPVKAPYKTDKVKERVAKHKKAKEDKINSEETLDVPLHGKLLLEEINEETRKKLLEKVVQPAIQLDDEAVLEVVAGEYRTPDYTKEPELIEEPITDKKPVPAYKVADKFEGIELPPVKTEKFVGEPVFYKTTAEELDKLVPMSLAYMKDRAEPIKLGDLVSYLLEYEGVKLLNGTHLMKHITKSTYHVEKVGYGQYEYEEKTFKSID